jgi:membrane-bound lytic murein transglycosylase D
MKRKMTFLLVIYLSLITNILAIEIPNNKRIDYWVNEFNKKRRQYYQLSIMRSGLYRPKVIEIFNNEGLPKELSWIPFVESGYNCSAKSKAEAAGCWQFVKKTGDYYGLERDNWKDQRYDFSKSTIAASKYLKELYKKFKKWDLALAAYNCGPTLVMSEIRKHGNDYWKLELPKETENYIPKFYAVLLISKNLKKYGFDYSKKKLIVVQLKKGSHNLRYIANKILGVDYKLFRRLNPGYDIGYTPPGRSSVIYLMKDWNLSLLEGFGLLAKKNAL